MLADVYIPRLSNDMKIAVQKNNLGGQIWYRSLDPVKKRRHTIFNSDRISGELESNTTKQCSFYQHATCIAPLTTRFLILISKI